MAEGYAVKGSPGWQKQLPPRFLLRDVALANLYELEMIL